MPTLIVSCSLNPNSRSRVLARAAHSSIEKLGVDADFVDLREFPLPLCDAAAAYSDPNALTLAQRIADSDGIIVACPIYNYTVSATLKNLIELTGDAWRDKVVAIVCAAGGPVSFMAHMGIANSLMLDYRCVIVPQFLHASDLDVTTDRIASAQTQRRLDDIVAAYVRIMSALNAIAERANPSR